MSQIITLDDLTTYSTGTNIDLGLGQQVVDAVNGYIEHYTGRVWGETKQVTERTNWRNSLWLSNQDVVSVQSIRYGTPGSDQTTLDSTDWYMNSMGRISLPRVSSHVSAISDYVEVTYTTGVLIVPDDLRLAALGIAQGFYQASQNGQKDVSEVQVGPYRVVYSNRFKGGEGSSHGANDVSWAVIDSYRKVRI